VQVRAAQPGTRDVRRYVMALLWIGAAVVCILPPYVGGEFYPAATLLLCVIATGWYYGEVPGQLSAIGSSLAFGFYVYRHDILLHAILHSVLFCVLSGIIGHRFSDQRKNTMHLCTENQQLKRMVDLAPVGMALLGLDRKLMRSNPALRRMFGLSDDQDGNSYLPLPESKQEEWEKLGEGLRRGESFTNVETLRTRSDGSKFYAHISATPLFDDSGELDGLVGVIADTSAIHRRYLERYVLESLVHRSIDFICVADLKQNVLFINDVGQKLVGLPEEEVIAALKFSDLFTGQNRDVLRNAILPRLVDGNADVQFRLELKHFAAGEPVRALCNLFSIHDPVSDEPVCIGCVAHLAGKAATDDHDEITSGQIPSNKVPVGIAPGRHRGSPLRLR
jgi:PAS domain S-box-containing protein